METVDAETDACTGADQTETSFASGTLIPHLGKDYHSILGFPSSYFRPHGHNVVWEGEQYIIEAKPVIFCFGSDLGSVQLPTSHAICVISQIKFYVWKNCQIYCTFCCYVLYIPFWFILQMQKRLVAPESI